jgi:hypothetical protein
VRENGLTEFVRRMSQRDGVRGLLAMEERANG